MKTTQLQKTLILVSMLAGVLAAGCELIVDFDRTKIPVESIDSGGLIDAALLGDGSIAPGDSGGTDADTAETSTEDAGDAGIQDAANDG